MAMEILLEEFTRAMPESTERPDVSLGGSDPEQAARSFEAGYTAGWEDALRAEEETQNRISSEFARNLQDVSFSFHEARAHVLRSFEPLLNEIVGVLVPKLAQAALGPMIMEEIAPFAELAADTEIELLVPLGSEQVVRPLLEANPSVPVTLIEEQSLADGQAIFRTGKHQRKIDLSGAAENITRALAAYYQNRETRHAI